MNKYIKLWLGGGLIALAAACSESLEDTYKDYAGDGEIRYMGKCTDVLVSPGWKRMIVSWGNNSDPCIKKVKVKWVLDDLKDSIFLDRGTSEYSITALNGADLEDGNYEISVCSVDADGRTSIPNTVFGRPYTYQHEEIMAFNRVISKMYVVRNRLILSFPGWQENMKEANLEYTRKDGSKATLALDAKLVNQHYYLLPDEIDSSKPLVLNRVGELSGCRDVIAFEPYSFAIDKTYEADFKEEMKRQYGYDENIPESWANSVETLYLDWSINSLVDILNLPNLKKLVLGSRRYLLSSAVNDATYGQSDVSDSETSDFVLKVMNELTGLTVERYAKHFQSLTSEAYIEDKGQTNEEPNVTMLDLKGLTFTSYPKDDDDWPSGLEHLTDGDVTTNWDPIYMQAFTAYELTLDLKTAKKLNGLKFVQKQFTRSGEISVAPNYLKIKVSNDQVKWTDATYLEENIVGKSNGEINYIPFSESTKATTWRYVRVDMNAGLYSGYYYSAVAEIGLY